MQYNFWWFNFNRQHFGNVSFFRYGILFMILFAFRLYEDVVFYGNSKKIFGVMVLPSYI